MELISFKRHKLDFRIAAKTSRNTFRSKEFLLIRVEDGKGQIGRGEIAPLEGLSPESMKECEELLVRIQGDGLPPQSELSSLPSSLRFGFEMAVANLNSVQENVFFRYGQGRLEKGLKINGLIWMGDKEYMLEQVEKKIEEGFSCIKIKIGGISWGDELELIMRLREQGGEDLEIRLDANGAFNKREFLKRWEVLKPLNIHSIEQPIPTGNWAEMHELVELGVPVALDEELISRDKLEEKVRLLDLTKAPFIVLKPSLHGGFSGVEEWIRLAEEREIGWWITSALESNLGLAAITQFAAQYQNPLAQGLGTGELFKNNFDTPLKREGEMLIWNP